MSLHCVRNNHGLSTDTIYFTAAPKKLLSTYPKSLKTGFHVFVHVPVTDLIAKL